MKILKYLFIFAFMAGSVHPGSVEAFADNKTVSNRIENLYDKFGENIKINFDEAQSTLGQLKELEPFFTKDQKDRVYIRHAAMLGFQGRHAERVKLVNSYIGDVTDPDMKVRFLSQLTGSYSSLGDYENAISTMRESESLTPKLKTVKGIAASLQGSINLLRTLKAYDEALVFANKMLELPANPKSPGERCLAILDTVELNFLRGDVQHARSLLPEADATCKVIGLTLYAQILEALSTIDLINSGNYDKGIQLGVPLTTRFDLLNHRSEYRMRLEDSLAKAFLAKGDLKSAEKYAGVAFQHAKSAQVVELIETTAETMATIKERQANSKDALNYLKTAFEYRKRRTTDDLQKSIAYQRAKLNTESKTAQLSELENKIRGMVAKSELDSKDKQLQLWIIIILGTLLTLSTTATILLIKQKRKLVKAEQIDQHTNVFARSYFIEAATAAVKYRRSSVGIILLHLDHFKKLNEAFGLSVGDNILAGVCSKIKEQLGPGDLIGRLDSDELGICLVGNEETTHAMAERCRQAILELGADQRAPDFKLTASIGIATVDTKGLTTFLETFNAARDGLSIAKSSGGNCVCSNR